MKNVVAVVEGDLLTIQVDLSQSQGPSASGKTIIIGTSSGNYELPELPGVFVGLNVYKRAET